MKSFLLLCFVLSPLIGLYPQSAYLTVDDPHVTTPSDGGTIESASLIVKPRGNYSIQEFDLSFSSRNTRFTSADTLEITLNFSLPAGSCITDLWLWVDSIPVRALIVDRGKARATYDNIVKRIRKDPAILEYLYSDYYRLRIFPLTGGDVRRIKLFYLTPYTVSAVDSLSLPIPVWILNASKNSIDTLTLTVQNNSWRDHPKIVGASGINFQESIDPELDGVMIAQVPGETMKGNNALKVGFDDANSSNSLFVEKFGDNLSGQYGMRLFPYQAMNLKTYRKILFLIDHDSLKSWYSKKVIYDDLLTTLPVTLLPGDSVNLIVSSKKGFIQAFPDWVAADSNSLHSAFAPILNSMALDTVNLGSLLMDGIQFVYSHGKENAAVFALASSHQYQTIASSNSYFDSLSKVFNFDFPIFFLNYGNAGAGPWIISDGQYYQGNAYVYRLISLNSHGNYSNYYSGSYSLNSVINDIRGTITFFDLTTTLMDGFTYEKTKSQASSTVPVFNYISQTGKYMGSFPLVVEMSGSYRDSIYHAKLIVSDSSVFQGDSTFRTYAAYQQIISLRQDYSQESKNRIVELSLDNRILTEYTAFLALEPGQKLCDTCGDNGSNIVVTIDNDPPEQIPSTYEILQAFPNPFNPSTTIRIRLPNNIDSKYVTLRIYNVLGQTIKEFDPAGLTSTSYKDITWDGTNTGGSRIASGVYFVLLSTPSRLYNLKIVLTR